MNIAGVQKFVENNWKVGVTACAIGAVVYKTYGKFTLYGYIATTLVASYQYGPTIRTYNYIRARSVVLVVCISVASYFGIYGVMGSAIASACLTIKDEWSLYKSKMQVRNNYTAAQKLLKSSRARVSEFKSKCLKSDAATAKQFTSWDQMSQTISEQEQELCVLKNEINEIKQTVTKALLDQNSVPYGSKLQLKLDQLLEDYEKVQQCFNDAISVMRGVSDVPNESFATRLL